MRTISARDVQKETTATESAERARCGFCGFLTCPSWCQKIRVEDVWKGQGLCVDTENLEVFFPGSNTPDQRAMVREAKDICWSCPVQEDCLQHALTVPEQHGIWGGYTAIERKRQRRELLAVLQRRRDDEKRLDSIR